VSTATATNSPGLITRAARIFHWRMGTNLEAIRFHLTLNNVINKCFQCDCKVTLFENACICNNINNQPDETITNFIDNYNQLNMFQAIISPLVRSTRLCLQLAV